MKTFKLTFKEEELNALNTIFDMALKARWLEVVDAIQYLKNKINAEIKEQQESKEVVEKVVKDIAKTRKQ